MRGCIRPKPVFEIDQRECLLMTTAVTHVTSARPAGLAAIAVVQQVVFNPW